MYGWRALVVANQCSEELWMGDWAKGPAGTGECAWTDMMTDIWSQKAGAIAESWDLSQLADGKVTFYIREGAYWSLDPENEASVLVGGREVTPEDVVWSFERACTDTSAYIYTAAPGLRETEFSVDGQAVTIKFTGLDMVEQGLCRFGDFCNRCGCFLTQDNCFRNSVFKN